MLVTALSAVPLGVAAGVYLEEYAPKNWMTDIIEINISNLAGIPSIVYGLLALGLFVYYFGFGQSILSAGLTLALLILPVIIVATRESIRAIPQIDPRGFLCLRCDDLADGQRPHPAVFQRRHPHRRHHRHGARHRRDGTDHHHRCADLHRLPAAGAVRGDPPAGMFDWIFAPFTVMPIQMFNWTSRPEAAFTVNAAAAGFVLVFMTLAMNGLAIYVRYRLRKNIKW
jgi:phosphate transport system permease protein